MWWIPFGLLLLLVVYRKPRAMWAVLLTALIVAAVAVYFSRQRVAMHSEISLKVQYDPGFCPRETPLHVTIRNDSSSVLKRITFGIRANVPGYSTVITPYTYKQYSSDKILQSGQEYGACYPLPPISKDNLSQHPLESLDWSGEVRNIYSR